MAAGAGPWRVRGLLGPEMLFLLGPEHAGELRKHIGDPGAARLPVGGLGGGVRHDRHTVTICM
jgi:hypothetical protein